jgi:hypothetical protein
MSGAQSFCAVCGAREGAGHRRWCPTAALVLGLAVLFFLLAGIAKGQDVPLSVQGGKVVKVDKVITIQVDATVIDKFPFTVSAPAGGGLHFWQYPAGVAATDKGDKLEVTAAPKGELTISVKLITADWDKKQFVTKFGSVTVCVGEVKPPKPPEPKPDVEPTDPLYQPLKAAWLKEVDRAKRDTLAEVYSLLSDEAKAPGIWLDARTVAEFSQRATAARKAAIGEALPLTRAVLTAELNKTLPTATAATMGQHRAAVAAFYSRIADLLRRLP